jgi:hypothetical protein
MYALPSSWPALSAAQTRVPVLLSVGRGAGDAADLPACLSIRPLRRAEPDGTCSPVPGTCRARGRRPGRTAAIPPLPSGPTTPMLTVPRCATDLTRCGKSELDAAAPRRQASPPCPPATDRAGKRERRRSAPEAAAWEPRPLARTGQSWHVADGPRLP